MGTRRSQRAVVTLQGDVRVCRAPPYLMIGYLLDRARPPGLRQPDGLHDRPGRLHDRPDAPSPDQHSGPLACSQRSDGDHDERPGRRARGGAVEQRPMEARSPRNAGSGRRTMYMPETRLLVTTVCLSASLEQKQPHARAAAPRCTLRSLHSGSNNAKSRGPPLEDAELGSPASGAPSLAAGTGQRGPPPPWLPTARRDSDWFRPGGPATSPPALVDVKRHPPRAGSSRRWPTVPHMGGADAGRMPRPRPSLAARHDRAGLVSRPRVHERPPSAIATPPFGPPSPRP